MDNKRVLNRIHAEGKGSGKHNKSANEDENAQICNNTSCNCRPNYVEGVHIGFTEKTTPLTPPSGSSTGKEIVKIPSAAGVDIACRKRVLSQRRSHFNQNPENDGLDGGISPSLPRTHKVIGTRNKEIDCGKTKLPGIGSSSITSNIMPWRKPPVMSCDGNQNTSAGPYVSSSSKATSSVSSCGLINVSCNGISDEIPVSLPTESTFNKRGEIRQRDPDEDSGSSFRGKKLTGHSYNEGLLLQPKRGICISDVRSSRVCNSGVNSGHISVTNGRTRKGNIRVAHSDRGKRNSASLGDFTLPISGSRRCQTPNNSELNASYQRTPDGSSSHSSYPSTTVATDVHGSVPSTSTEVGMPRFGNLDAYWQYNIDEIDEVLMELERIHEQNEDMMYERLLALETNLLISSLNVFDQHRDMRMNIDNMSYEELLALEEKIGAVSTSLSEEEITECLHRSIYQLHSSAKADLDFRDQNDIKCTVCQEEYVVGDEIGNLGCEHSYHVQCIEKWLRLKNWCPVCKGPAAGTDSSP